MLTRMEVSHFKGFSSFAIAMQGLTVLIGPNNAGKSTLISALRSAALMLRYAQRRKPELREDPEGDTLQQVYQFDNDPFEIGLDNLRHDFRPGDSAIQLDFEDPYLRLRCVWPQSEDPYFFIIDPASGWQPTTPKQFRELGDLIGVIPTLGPLEPIEPQLDPNYVARNLGGRLSSRHFRNQVGLLDSLEAVFGFDWKEYVEFCSRWAADITLEHPERRKAESGYEMDFFFNEGRGPRELTWAGDGFQVWLQLLLHILRLRHYDTIVLDEPEVFLHPDLQRRLIRVLEAFPSQAILATHSPEIAAEVSQESIVLVDRIRQRGVSPREMGASANVDLGLGTRHNFALARSLRASLTLFVEGKDATILRHLADRCDAPRFANEIGISIVRLDGIDNRQKLTGFGWLAHELLGGALRGFVILDRDFRMPELLDGMKADLVSYGLAVHLWHRKELESYLLVPEAMSRVSASPLNHINETLDQAVAELRPYVQAQYVAVSQANRPKGEDSSVATERALAYLETEWMRPEGAASLCPARKLLSTVNDALQAGGYKAISAKRLAREVTVEEVPSEMRGVIQTIESMID